MTPEERELKRQKYIERKQKEDEFCEKIALPLSIASLLVALLHLYIIFFLK